MWSWHIWVWVDDLTPVTITNKTGVNYNILPVNLASKWDANTNGRIYNWFYQFGRPTPTLPPNRYNSNTDAENYGDKTFEIKNTAISYKYGIMYPYTFYYNRSSPYLWYGGDKVYYNLWDANCTSTGSSDNIVVKTVYDPCPVGFKMPNGNTFTYFSKVNVIGVFDYGWRFKRNADDTSGVFFPASGRRSYEDGDLTTVGSYSYVALSNMSSSKKIGSLRFDSSSVYPSNDSIVANGCSVRPVQE